MNSSGLEYVPVLFFNSYVAPLILYTVWRILVYEAFHTKILRCSKNPRERFKNFFSLLLFHMYVYISGRTTGVEYNIPTI